MFISELFITEWSLSKTPKDHGQAHRDGIDLEAWKDNLEFQISATAHGRDLGRVVFDVQYQGDQPILVAKDLMILPEYRGQGIAGIMYDYAKELGYQVERSKEQTDAGKHFWDKNRGDERVWESELDEVTTVPTVAKKKTQHLDVMPNDGRPIPAGEETHHLGKQAGRLGNVEVWTYNQGTMRTYVVFDPETRVSQLAVTGSRYPNHPNSFIVKGVYSGPKNQTRAADLYYWLIQNQGLTLVSDIKQSEGGQRVWQELERRYGRHIRLHGFNAKTNKPINVGAQHDTETHVGQEHLPGATRDMRDIASNVRLVASPK